MPSIKPVKFSYTATWQITTGTLQNQLFSLNWLYDPMQSYSANQPWGFDELAAFYYKYVIRRASVKVFMINRTSACVKVGMFANNVSSNVSTIEAAMNQNAYALLNKAGNEHNTRLLKRNFNIRSFFGKTANDENFTALCGSDPAQMLYLHLVTAHEDGTTAIDVLYTIEIK